MAAVVNDGWLEHVPAHLEQAQKAVPASVWQPEVLERHPQGVGDDGLDHDVVADHGD